MAPSLDSWSCVATRPLSGPVGSSASVRSSAGGFVGVLSLANMVAVPRRAVMSGPQGRFVWVVAEGDKAEFRPVQIGRGVGNNVLVTSGLNSGDRVVVEGVLKVQPGIQVTAVPYESPDRQADAQKAKRNGDA